MFLNLARVSPASFARIKEQTSLLDAIFFDDDAASKKKLAALGIDEDHTAGCDYLSAQEALVAMAEATGEELDEDDDAVLADLGVTGELDYDAGYGPAFYISPSGITQATNSIVCEMDDEVKAVIQAAAEAGEYLVGVIS